MSYESEKKCSSLVPPRIIFIRLNELVRVSISTSKKVWKFWVKIQLTKSDCKCTGGGKCPASCQLGLRPSEGIQIVRRRDLKKVKKYLRSDQKEHSQHDAIFGLQAPL